MSILVNKDSRVLVAGITGKSGRIQTEVMLAAGTNIVAGVTPGKGGQEV
ncbi:MAG: succinate--CoA ligase subunit alpha, partial [Clostridia bacterium]|nr:succinate--CoA ligase subunit alpha [Clostridia bacterium]